MVTPSLTSARLSKPQTNSPMIRSTRQESDLRNSCSDGCGGGLARSCSSSVGIFLSSRWRYGFCSVTGQTLDGGAVIVGHVVEVGRDADMTGAVIDDDRSLR